jgi:hypothetical protein
MLASAGSSMATSALPLSSLEAIEKSCSGDSTDCASNDGASTDCASKVAAGAGSDASSVP